MNGRTRIATLIEEAPSVAAMIACVGYASEKDRGVMMRSPMIPNRKESLIAKVAHRENCSLIAFTVVFTAVDELSLLYYFENYPPSTKQQPSKRAAVPLFLKLKHLALVVCTWLLWSTC